MSGTFPSLRENSAHTDSGAAPGAVHISVQKMLQFPVGKRRDPGASAYGMTQRNCDEIWLVFNADLHMTSTDADFVIIIRM